jgi:hypothetical protein
MLLKLLATMQELNIIRGTIMSNENESCSKFYIIVEGEFELTKRIYKPVSEYKDEFLQEEKSRLKKRNEADVVSNSCVYDGGLELNYD